MKPIKAILLIAGAALLFSGKKEATPDNPTPGSDVEPTDDIQPVDEPAPDIIDNNPIDNITLTLPSEAVRPKDGSTVQQITYVK